MTFILFVYFHIHLYLSLILFVYLCLSRCQVVAVNLNFIGQTAWKQLNLTIKFGYFEDGVKMVQTNDIVYSGKGILGNKQPIIWLSAHRVMNRFRKLLLSCFDLWGTLRDLFLNCVDVQKSFRWNIRKLIKWWSISTSSPIPGDNFLTNSEKAHKQLARMSFVKTNRSSIVVFFTQESEARP